MSLARRQNPEDFRWQVLSESDPRWNGGGEATSLWNAMAHVEAHKHAKASLGASPDDLKVAYLKVTPSPT